MRDRYLHAAVQVQTAEILLSFLDLNKGLRTGSEGFVLMPKHTHGSVLDINFLLSQK